MTNVDYLSEVSAIRGKLDLINGLIHQFHDKKAEILSEYSKLEASKNEQSNQQ